MPRRYRKRMLELVCYGEGEISQEILDIAKKRVSIHLRNFHMTDYNLLHLLTDVYLQGLHDMATAVANNDLLNDTELEPLSAVLEFEI